jgi:hypothetical protein
MPPGLVRGVVTFSSAQAWRHSVGLPLNSNVRRHMRAARVIAVCLTTASGFSAAQQNAGLVAPRCLESGAMYSSLPGGGKLTASIAPDVRGLAGFGSAFVISILVPPNTSSILFSGEVEIRALGSATRVTVNRAEYWLMGHFPRSAVPITNMSLLPPMDEEGSTLYKLYFQAPESTPEAFSVLVPPMVSGTTQLVIPQTRFERGRGKSGLVICLLPE